MTTLITTKKNKSLFLLDIANFLQYQRFLMPISYLFYLHNGLNFSDFLLFQSIFSLTCLITRIPMGIIGDYFLKKYILIFAYLLFLFRVILWLTCQGWWIILVGEILYGLSKALYQGNVDSYIYEYLEDNKQNLKITSHYGNLVFYTSFGSAVSCLLGVLLYKSLGFKILLLTELILQIFAILLLCCISKTKIKQEHNGKFSIKDTKNGIALLFKNKKLNYKVYYSAILIGLTKIFVWTFQPLLKMCNAPVLLFGITNLINQLLRGLGGKLSRIIIAKTKNNLLNIEYTCAIFPFGLLILSIYFKNYILSTISIMLVCVAIMFFVVYNALTISEIQINTKDNKRASKSSSYTFLGDFASFSFILIFKFLHNYFNISRCLLIFCVIFLILLCPVFINKEKI